MMRDGLFDQLQTDLHAVPIEVAELTAPEWPNMLHMTDWSYSTQIPGVPLIGSALTHAPPFVGTCVFYLSCFLSTPTGGRPCYPHTVHLHHIIKETSYTTRPMLSLPTATRLSPSSTQPALSHLRQKPSHPSPTPHPPFPPPPPLTRQTNPSSPSPNSNPPPRARRQA